MKYIILAISFALIFMATKTYKVYVDPEEINSYINDNSPYIVKKRETNYIFKDFEILLKDNNSLKVNFKLDIKSKYVNFKNIEGSFSGELYFKNNKIYITPSNIEIQEEIKGLTPFLRKYINLKPENVNVSAKRIEGPLISALEDTSIFSIENEKTRYFDNAQMSFEDGYILITRQFLIGYSGFFGIIIFITLVIISKRKERRNENFRFNF